MAEQNTNWNDKSWADLGLFGTGVPAAYLYKSDGPLDAKLVIEKYDYLEGLVAKNIAYEGMIAYVKDQRAHYTCFKNGNSLSWKVFGSSNDNQTVTVSGTTFDADAAVNFVAGDNIGIEASNDGNTITISTNSVTVNNTTPPGGTSYYPLYAAYYSGQQQVLANPDLYYYDYGSNSYFNIGSAPVDSDNTRPGNNGGLTLHYVNSDKTVHGLANLVTDALTNNAVRTIKLPDCDGTIFTTGNPQTVATLTTWGENDTWDTVNSSGGTT
jgi:hypothetical protein